MWKSRTRRGVWRTTFHGCGIPKVDLQTPQGGYARLEQKRIGVAQFVTIIWGAYQRHQLYGHVEAQRRYESRESSGRFPIPLEQHRHAPPLKSQLPGNIKQTAQSALNPTKIWLQSTTPEVWGCVECGEQGE